MIEERRSLNQEIAELINMIDDVDRFTEDNIISKCSYIKKMFNSYITNHKKEGTLTLGKLENFRTQLMRNYDSVKLYSQINEIIEKLAMEYDFIIEEYENNGNNQEVERLEKYVFEMHTKTFGNPGGHPEKFSPSYLEKIIRAKIDSRGINNPDIINILKRKFKNTTFDLEEYQELIDNVIMSTIKSNIETGSPEIKNAEILTIIKDYALTYKENGDLEKCKEIINTGLQLKMFEQDERYDLLRKAYPKEESAIDFEALKNEGFEVLDLSDLGKINDEEKLFNAFFEKLKVMPAFSEIFKNNDIIYPNSTPDLDPNPSPDPKVKNIIPKEIKVRNIFRILRLVQHQYPNVDITKAYVGKDAFMPKNGEKNDIKSFEDYVIFEVDNSGQVILECFSETSEGALVIVDREKLPKIISMSRSDAKKLDDVFFKNHDNTNIDPNTKEKVYHYIASTADELIDRIQGRQAKKSTVVTQKDVGNEEYSKNQDKKIDVDDKDIKEETSLNTEESKEDKSVDSQADEEFGTNEPKKQESDLEDMSIDELMEYSSKIDSDIQEVNDENAKIREAIEETCSVEEKLRRELIEGIKAKQQELEAIKEEQRMLREQLTEKQREMKTAKKRVFGDL